MSHQLAALGYGTAVAAWRTRCKRQQGTLLRPEPSSTLTMLCALKKKTPGQMCR
jgi:hypothetical protein